MLGKLLPQVTFKTRVRDEKIGGDNPFKWLNVTTKELFENKKITCQKKYLSKLLVVKWMNTIVIVF